MHGGRPGSFGGGFAEGRGGMAGGHPAFVQQGASLRASGRQGSAAAGPRRGDGWRGIGPQYAERREGGGSAGRHEEGFRATGVGGGPGIREGGWHGGRGWDGAGGGSGWGAGGALIGVAGAGLAADAFWRSESWWQPAYGWAADGWRWDDAVIVGGPAALFAMPPVVFAPPPLFVVPPPIVLGVTSFLPPGPVATAPTPPPLVAAAPVIVPEQMFHAVVPPPIVVLPPPPVLIAAEPPPVIFAPLLIAPPLALATLAVDRVGIGGWGQDRRGAGWSGWHGGGPGYRYDGFGGRVAERRSIGGGAGGWGGQRRDGWAGNRGGGGGWHAGGRARAWGGGPGGSGGDQGGRGGRDGSGHAGWSGFHAAGGERSGGGGRPGGGFHRGH